MTDEWKDVFSTVTKLADSYGMEMAIAGSPGWSESGGPWVAPEQAMKKVVWSETNVNCGAQFNGKLPAPPSVAGTFQNIAQGRGGWASVEGKDNTFYEDIAVIAIKVPGNASAAPKVLSNGGPFHYAQLTDGDLVTASTLAYQSGNGDSWITYEFPEARTVYGATLVGSAGGGRGFGRGATGNAPALESSNDGKTFTKEYSRNVRGKRLGLSNISHYVVDGNGEVKFINREANSYLNTHYHYIEKMMNEQGILDILANEFGLTRKRTQDTGLLEDFLSQENNDLDIVEAVMSHFNNE
jgi:hypothetical protein